MPPKVSKEFLKSLKDAGATDAVIGLFTNTGGSEEQPTEEPTLGLGTKNTGVRSTQGALPGENVGDGVTQTSASNFKFAAQDKDRQKFFRKPVRRPNRKLGAEGKLGETKEVYSPRREMRRAMRVGDVLTKRGYGDVAKDLVRGSLGGAVAPSIQSPEMRAAMYQQNIEAQTLDRANQDYMRRIMAQKFNQDQFKIGGV